MLALAGGWMKYGAEQAVFGGNKEEIDAWQSVYADVANKGGLGLLSFPTNDNLRFAAAMAARNFKSLGIIVILKQDGQSSLAKAGGSMQELNKIQIKKSIFNKPNLNRLAVGMRAACLQRVAGAVPPAANTVR